MNEMCETTGFRMTDKVVPTVEVEHAENGTG